MNTKVKTNVTKVRLGTLNSLEVSALTQYDKGQIIEFIDNFADGTEVQFATTGAAETINKIIENNRVEIPDSYMEGTATIMAWVKVITTESETTVKEIRIPITPRTKPADYIAPEDEQTFREQMQEIMEDTEQIAQSVRDDADAGRFDGKDGKDYTITESDYEAIAEITKELIKVIDDSKESGSDTTWSTDKIKAWLQSYYPTYSVMQSTIEAFLNNYYTMAKTDEKIAEVATKTEDSLSILEQVTNGYYQGRNLKVVFREEIAEYDNAFAWIKQRCKDNNFEGINIGDYIPLVVNNLCYYMQIAGIDTYYSPLISAGGAWSGNPNKYHQVDFVADTTYGSSVQWNTTASNVGTSSEPYPYRASNLYKYLNETVYNLIPEDVRTLIAEKYLPLTKKTGSAYSGIDNIPIGKVWTLCACEISPGLIAPNDRNTLGLQYPLMKTTNNRIKYKSPIDTSPATYIWVIDVVNNNSTNAYWVDKYTGSITGGYATNFNARTYFGFRIQGD